RRFPHDYEDSDRLNFPRGGARLRPAGGRRHLGDMVRALQAGRANPRRALRGIRRSGEDREGRRRRESRCRDRRRSHVDPDPGVLSRRESGGRPHRSALAPADRIEDRGAAGMTTETTKTATNAPKRLSTLDKWLPLWIGLAMVAGLLLGRFIPGISDLLSHMEIGGISVPIALGLLVMMYPVLAKVRYDKVAAVTGDKRLLISSLVLNWLAGPAIMFALAW